MTNFEKWKNELTIENCTENFCYYNYTNCIKCPAEEWCDRENIPLIDCNERFLEWANQELD